MKKLIRLILLILVIPTTALFAQQDSQYTQYMYNTITVNPAYAGTTGHINITGLYRNQWVGINGAPTTMNFSAHSPLGNNGLGIGLSFFNDEIGPAEEQNVNVDLSYTLNLRNDLKLAFGIKGGINVLNVNFNDLTFNPLDPNSQNLNGKVSPNIGAGAYLFSDNWYVGLSSPNLLNTTHYREDIVSSSITEELHMYLIAGYVFDLNRDLKFKPAVLAKSVNGAPLALDVSANFLFYDKFTLGAAYRFDASVSALAGFQISDNIMIGYAYDYQTTDLSNYSSGSHEVFLRFEIFKNLGRIVNPRFF